MAKRDYQLITNQEDLDFLLKDVCAKILDLIWDTFSFNFGQIFMGLANKAYWRGYDRGYKQARLDQENKPNEPGYIVSLQ